MEPDQPEADVIDQLRPVDDEDIDPAGGPVPLEADPTDVLEQQAIVPLDQDEP